MRRPQRSSTSNSRCRQSPSAFTGLSFQTVKWVPMILPYRAAFFCLPPCDNKTSLQHLPEAQEEPGNRHGETGLCHQGDIGGTGHARWRHCPGRGHPRYPEVQPAPPEPPNGKARRLGAKPLHGAGVRHDSCLEPTIPYQQEAGGREGAGGGPRHTGQGTARPQAPQGHSISRTISTACSWSAVRGRPGSHQAAGWTEPSVAQESGLRGPQQPEGWASSPDVLGRKERDPEGARGGMVTGASLTPRKSTPGVHA